MTLQFRVQVGRAALVVMWSPRGETIASVATRAFHLTMAHVSGLSLVYATNGQEPFLQLTFAIGSPDLVPASLAVHLQAIAELALSFVVLMQRAFRMRGSR